MIRALLGNCKNQTTSVLQRIHTRFLRVGFKNGKRVNFGSKSASAKTFYPELALRAAIDPSIYSVFRRHHLYTPILEHVSLKDASLYLNIIKDVYHLADDEIYQATEPLQCIGSPYKIHLDRLRMSISTTSLRYLKVALEIKDKLKDGPSPDLVEIGCGYGGQAVVLDRIMHINSYTFIDLWQVNYLIQRFIEDAGINCKYRLATLGSLDGLGSWDMVISNYAFSELPQSLQLKYFDQVLSLSRRGYLIMNSGVDGKFDDINNLPQDSLLKLIPGSRIADEIPVTFSENYLLEW